MVHPYDRSALLTLAHPDYVADLERFVMGAYESDVAGGDVTTASLGMDFETSATIVAKREGVFCGRIEAEWLLSRVGGVTARFLVQEGARFEVGAMVVEVSGSASVLLKVERTLLNLLQRLSGIATLTDAFVERAGLCRVAATRKTLWGRLDKRAVAVGGGLTHRLSLGDAPMYKDTHFDAVGHAWGAVAAALDRLPRELPFVTIEVRQADRLPDLMRQLPTSAPWPIFLLFDNFSPEELVAALHGVERPEGVWFEASGGVTLESVANYSGTGVDVVSVGALTHSVVAADFSMRVG